MHISGNFTVAMISIHAPTRGATKYRVCAFTVHRFQSTLPRGERPEGDRYTLFAAIFQSTLPRGERPGQRKRYEYHNVDFNPRSHEGSDPLSRGRTSTYSTFTPRSPPGSDSAVDFSTSSGILFQSTLPRGERLRSPVTPSNLYGISIHAPTRGAT